MEESFWKGIRKLKCPRKSSCLPMALGS
jgi:hypothetical protein